MFPESLNPKSWAFSRDTADPSIAECGGLLLLFEPREVAELIELHVDTQLSLARRYRRADGSESTYDEAAAILRAAAGEIGALRVGDVDAARALAKRYRDRHAACSQLDYNREAYALVFGLTEIMLMPQTVYRWATPLVNCGSHDREIRREAMFRIAAAARAADVTVQAARQAS